MIKAKVLRAFISCPSDMSDECQVVQQAIEKFSELYCDEDILIKPVHFKQLPSDFGGEVQDVINESLPDYDVYIGIMGERFGTPTRSYKSGTEEEFRIALKKKNDNPDIHVAFYFKDIDKPASKFSSAEWDEYKRVLDFKEELQEENNGLYQTFTDHDELNNQISVVLKKSVKTYSDTEELKSHQLEMLTPVLSKDTFSIDQEYYSKFLSAIGAELTNNHKSILSLSDIYVPLDLSHLSHDSENEKVIIEDEIVSAENIENYGDQEVTKIIVSGEENAGKTTLCKRTFVNFHRHGVIPVFIKGKDIRSADFTNFSKHIQKQFVEQYNMSALAAYNKLPKRKKLLIVDDFNESRLNDKHKIALLKQLEEHYGHILVTVDELFLFNCKLSSYEDFKSLLPYDSYKFRDAGHKLRDRMIRQWLVAGREDSISDEVLFSETERNRSIIDTMIGGNFVPKKPFIILVLLQAIQGGTQSELTHSSYVRYYKFLIDKTLLSNVPQNRLEVYYAFLPEFSFALYNSDTRGLTKDQLDGLIKRFCDQKGLHEDLLKDVKSNLLSLDMLVFEDNQYRFSHSYAYYYFLGQYLSENLEKLEVRNLIESLCERLYVKENSNIIVFLSYHTNDSIIIDKITEITDSLFSDVSVFGFDNSENSSINQLVSNSPKVIVNHQSEKKEREKVLKSKDEIDGELQDKQLEEDEEYDALDLSAQINLAFRSMEIIGQLLKNHYVRFDADPKKELHTKAINLGLKSLNVLMSHISDDIDGLLAHFSKELEGSNLKKAADRLEAEKEIKKDIFNFVSYIVFGFIKATSQYTGADTLSKTYEDVLEENNFLIYRAIDLSIKLDFFDTFPMQELRTVASYSASNHLASTVVKNLVKYRLYMRPLDDFKKKQQICDTVGISLKTQLLLEDKNKEKSAA